MPNLVELDLAKIDIHQFLPDATFYRDRWDTKSVSHEYPYEAFIYRCDENKRMLKNVRVYIERFGIDDVLYRSISKNYQYSYNIHRVQYSWDEEWSEIRNHWWQFYFGSEKDLTMLSLKYPNVFYRTLPKFSPEYDYHNEENTRRW